jgi:site-specific DNA-methyltransferase (adenine-specific)
MDCGTASRFFYSAKADAQDRFGGKHPTVKPINLMRWLTRLVTPPNGLVLDLFAGSGTTGAAAVTEGFRAILIEADPEYQADIRERLAWLSSHSKRLSTPLTECLAP